MERKRAILLLGVGSSTYDIILSLTTPSKLSMKSFQELVELVKNHHDPPPSVTVQRHKFSHPCKITKWTIFDFLASLSIFSKHCNFGCMIKDVMHDRLVCRINDQNIQRKSLSESRLTYGKAADITLLMKTADKDLCDLQKLGSQSSQFKQVHHVKQRM